MLPAVHGLFRLVRAFAARAAVTEIAASKWLVQRHGLAPLAARAGFVNYRDDLARAAVQWERYVRALEPLFEQLAAAGVRVAPIKGLAYARTLYATPAERPMSDVDLLVAPDQEALAFQVVE